jgi:hypothetical protein
MPNLPSQLLSLLIKLTPEASPLFFLPYGFDPNASEN